MNGENDNGKQFHLSLNAEDRANLEKLRKKFQGAYGVEISRTATIRAAIRHLAKDLEPST